MRPHERVSCLPTVAAHTCRCVFRNRYGDVVLVVMFNVAFSGWLEVHEQLSAAYKPLFRQIVYTGFHRQVYWPLECDPARLCLGQLDTHYTTCLWLRGHLLDWGILG